MALKQEALSKIGYEEQALVLANKKLQQHSFETKSQSSIVSGNTALEPFGRQKAIEYLNNNNESKESVRDFINFSRKILMSQIAINDKTEENQRLKEYITMEQEKIDEARNLLEEDKEKFEKLMNDSDKMAKKVMEQVKRLAAEKQGLIKEIETLQN